MQDMEGRLRSDQNETKEAVKFIQKDLGDMKVSMKQLETEIAGIPKNEEPSHDVIQIEIANIKKTVAWLVAGFWGVLILIAGFVVNALLKLIIT